MICPIMSIKKVVWDGKPFGCKRDECALWIHGSEIPFPIQGRCAILAIGMAMGTLADSLLCSGKENV